MGKLANIFTLLMSIGVLGSLSSGLVIDAYGLETCFVLNVIFGQLFNIIFMIFPNHYYVMIVGFIFYSLFRQYLFPLFIGGLMTRFGFRYFGLLLGTGFFISGVVQLFIADFIQYVQGNCHDQQQDKEGQQNYYYCHSGHWKEFHIIQIIILSILLYVPYRDYQETNQRLKQATTDYYKNSNTNNNNDNHSIL